MGPRRLPQLIWGPNPPDLLRPAPVMSQNGHRLESNMLWQTCDDMLSLGGAVQVAPAGAEDDLKETHHDHSSGY